MSNLSINTSRVHSGVEQHAARTIFRAYKKEYLVFLELFRDENILSLTPIQFANWLNFISKRLIRPIKVFTKLKLLVKKTIDTKWQERFGVTFTKIGAWPRSLPCFTLEKVNESKLHSIDGVYYTKEMYEDLTCTFGTTLTTKEEVDDLIPLLTNSNLIEWACPWEGCFARADLAGQLLRNTGIENRIFKQYIFGEFKNGAAHFHVALGIGLATGKVCILDLTLNPSSSLTREEWIAKCIKNPQGKRIVMGKERMIPDIKNHITLLEVGLDYDLASDFESGKRVRIKRLIQKNREYYISLMGRLRVCSQIQKLSDF